MNIKSLLLGSAAALVAASGAQAADAIVAPEPEAVEYVRVCDAYGAGYFYIPGTETCLRIHGYVRYDVKGGDDVYARGGSFSRLPDGGASLILGGKDRDTYAKTARATLRFSTASETELGTLKTYIETRFQWSDGNDSGSTGTLRYGYIELGGLRVGLDESAFVTFPGYLGNVMNDDVILAGGYRTGLISYTFNGGNGFSAIVSLEQGNNVDVDYNGVIDDYMPHVVGGLKYAGGWGSLAAVAAYDATNEEWAGKIRADINVTDRFSVWAMGGYKSNDDTYYGYTDADGNFRGIRAIDSFYGTGVATGLSGVVLHSRQPKRLPSTCSSLMKMPALSQQPQTLLTSWFPASPSPRKFPTPSGTTHVRFSMAKMLSGHDPLPAFVLISDRRLKKMRQRETVGAHSVEMQLTNA